MLLLRCVSYCSRYHGFVHKNEGGNIMPIVTVKLLEGRTDDQKRELIKKVTDVVVETAVCEPERVSVIIEEMPLTNFGKAGVRPCDQ